MDIGRVLDTGLTGGRDHHFELNLGVLYYIDARNENNRRGSPNNGLFPNFSVGYRKLSSKGYMFRTGLGTAEWIYFGLGYSF